MEDDVLKLIGNLMNSGSTKSKRVTRNLLATKTYGMATDVDMAIAIGTPRKLIATQYSIPVATFVVCIDKVSLYKYLVKFGSANKKRFMIHFMDLR